MIVCASGYFNPIHKGHIFYLETAKALGEELVVIVNTDEQVALKGSKPFMDIIDRVLIVSALRCVDKVVFAKDKDGTVCKTLEMIKPDIFAKGGDSTPENTPEMGLCERLGIVVKFGIGGEKIQSSTQIKVDI